MITENGHQFDPRLIVWIALILASCVHVFIDSKNDRRIGHPWIHSIMCLVVLWPLVYVLWLFWWPGKLRQAVFGSEKSRAEKWAQKRLGSVIPEDGDKKT